MLVEIDRDACIGCKLCVETCQDTFEMDEMNKAVVFHEPDKRHEGCAMAAATECPTDAIILQ